MNRKQMLWLKTLVVTGVLLTLSLFSAAPAGAQSLDWTVQDSGTTRDLHGLLWHDGRFIAVGDSETILSSPEGADWTELNSGSGNTLKGITYGNDLYVAVGYNGTVFTSLHLTGTHGRSKTRYLPWT